MSRWFRRFLIADAILFVAYIVVSLLMSQKMPQELLDWAMADMFRRPLAMGISAILGLAHAGVFLLSLTMLFFFSRLGRWLFLVATPVLFLAAMVPSVVVVGDRWSAILQVAVLVVYGVIAGLLFHPEIRGKFQGLREARAKMPASKKRRLAIGGCALSLFIAIFGCFGGGWLLVRVVPQPPTKGLSVAGFAPLTPDSTTPEIEAALEKLAGKFVKEPLNVGIAIGVTRNGERIIVTRGSQSKNGENITPNTQFEIGSISKTFTGVVLADSVQRRLVELDQPIQSFLPVDSTGEPPDTLVIEGSPVSLLDLATHHAGFPRLPDDVGPLRSLRESPYAGFTEDDLHAAIARVQPGQREYAYSNFGMSTLAHLLSRAHEREFAEVQNDLCRQLGMNETGIYRSLAEKTAVASGHRWGMATAFWHDSGTYIDGAGSTLSTTTDMLAWLEAHLDPDSTPIPEALRLAMKGHREISEGDKSRTIGLAWHRNENADKGPILEHDGGTGGFFSYAGFAPEAKTGVVVLVNSSDSAAIGLGVDLLRALAGWK